MTMIFRLLLVALGAALVYILWRVYQKYFNEPKVDPHDKLEEIVPNCYSLSERRAAARDPLGLFWTQFFQSNPVLFSGRLCCTVLRHTPSGVFSQSISKYARMPPAHSGSSGQAVGGRDPRKSA